jgi:hypothetical protein
LVFRRTFRLPIEAGCRIGYRSIARILSEARIGKTTSCRRGVKTRVNRSLVRFDGSTVSTTLDNGAVVFERGFTYDAANRLTSLSQREMGLLPVEFERDFRPIPWPQPLGACDRLRLQLKFQPFFDSKAPFRA